jgi:glycosyltransferase involved in cell wall biosynthesis
MILSSPPKISVLLPVYNAAATLTTTIESLQSQTVSDWEAIIVDDGSVDATATVAESLARLDPRLRVFRRPHAGIVEALNFGLSQTRGEFVARQDGDDESLPQRFEQQLKAFELDPELGLVSCFVQHAATAGWQTNAEAQTRGYASYCDWLNSFSEPHEIRRASFIESPLAHPTVLFRRSLVDLHGGYRDGDFPEDYELWLRWLDAGVKMQKAKETLYVWNDAPERLSRTDARYAPDAFLELKSKSLVKWLQRFNPQHPEVVIWGAGTLSKRRARRLQEDGCTIRAFIEVNPKRRGQKINNVPIYLLDQFDQVPKCFIVSVVGNRGAGENIRKFLLEQGRTEEREFLICS